MGRKLRRRGNEELRRISSKVDAKRETRNIMEIIESRERGNEEVWRTSSKPDAKEETRNKERF